MFGKSRQRFKYSGGFFFIIGVRGNVTAFAIIKPCFNVLNQSTFSANPEEMTVTEAVNLRRIGDLLFQLSFKHFPTEFESIFKSLYAGITKFFVAVRITCPGKGAVEADNGFLQRGKINRHWYAPIFYVNSG